MKLAREALNKAIEEYGLGSKEALRASEELDKYMVKMQKVKAKVFYMSKSDS